MYCNFVKMEWGKTVLMKKNSHELRTVWQFYNNGFKKGDHIFVMKK